jgi:hypothetical protein
MLVLGFMSCKKDMETTQPENLTSNFIGTWVNPQYSDSLISFNRSSSLPENGYGLSILEKGNLVERKNIGWCGTPPVIYGDYEGNWQLENELLVIRVGYWGGTAIYNWQVIQVNEDSLLIKRLNEEYEIPQLSERVFFYDQPSLELLKGHHAH